MVRFETPLSAASAVMVERSAAEPDSVAVTVPVVAANIALRPLAPVINSAVVTETVPVTVTSTVGSASEMSPKFVAKSVTEPETPCVNVTEFVRDVAPAIRPASVADAGSVPSTVKVKF